MNDLPAPVQQGQYPPATQPGVASQSAPQSAVGNTVTPKELLEKATTQVEQIVAGTPASPYERAEQLHAVKAAYVRALYNVEIGSK